VYHERDDDDDGGADVRTTRDADKRKCTQMNAKKRAARDKNPRSDTIPFFLLIVETYFYTPAIRVLIARQVCRIICNLLANCAY